MSRLVKLLLFGTGLLLLLNLPRYTGPDLEPHANCCLCMCHAKDETKCHPACIERQHSKRIIEEPEMNICTDQCNRYGVARIEETQ